MMKKTLVGCLSVIALSGLVLVSAMAPVSAQDAKKQPSDRVVDFLETFVKGFLIPEEIPLSDGTKMKVDRKNPAEMQKFAIPREDMRRIIRIAVSGATAEICQRVDLQVGAYRWLKAQELKKKKWSNQQMFFISRLFVATVMWETGKADPVVKEDDGTATTDTSTEKAQALERKKIVCTDARRQSVQKLEAFLKEAGKG